MSIAFSIGGVNFYALGTADGRYAMDIDVQAPVRKRTKFHVPGVNGRYVVDGGIEYTPILCRVRYVGTVSAAEGNYASDRASFSASAIAIVDHAGATQSGCNLIHMRRVSAIQATGRATGKVFFDVEALFEKDA